MRLFGSDATGDVALIATPVKALADYVYVYRKEWLTPDPAIRSLRIDPEDLASVPKDDLDETMENYRNKRVLRFLSGLRREYGLNRLSGRDRRSVVTGQYREKGLYQG